MTQPEIRSNLHRQAEDSRRCSLRNLNLISLTFGLAAAGSLSLAASTDFWLYTNELFKAVEDNFTSYQDLDSYDYPQEFHQITGLSQNNNLDEDYIKYNEDDIYYYNSTDYNEYNSNNFAMTTESMATDPNLMMIRTHSGLWRTCIMHDNEGYESEIPNEVCYIIGYMEQSWERQDSSETTLSILRSIRRSTPFVVLSLFLLFVSLAFSIVGQNKKNFTTIIGALLYIFAALVLAMGIILYISAVNDEVSHRKKTENDSKTSFTYDYGWAFFFGAASFLCSMGAAVSNISIYIRNYPTNPMVSHYSKSYQLMKQSNQLPLVHISCTSQPEFHQSTSKQNSFSSSLNSSLQQETQQNGESNIRLAFSSFIL